ncbi:MULTISPECIES: hypothetical protein [unclassified Halomonas]|uniref:hypothetical protein n=1 Tax=unclassified Halomonas TaxID=2609666 RepID=UPI0021E3F39B|nr:MULTISPECIES: hypothetical protein [unclassified Halomonas]UYF98896.1 hypothetical protein OCT39_11735 [Halomonas sp. GD1P12]WNL39987.1 hypothetical protein RN346_05335 [Halomonas sp. PAMB 3232]
MVQISYSHHTADREFVHRRITTDRFEKASDIIDQYPYQHEAEMFEELGSGGGLEFLLGDLKGQHAHYNFIPVEADKGILDLSIVAKKGVFNLLGRKALIRHFYLVTPETARAHIAELFEHSVEFLYEKHRPFKS